MGEYLSLLSLFHKTNVFIKMLVKIQCVSNHLIAKGGSVPAVSNGSFIYGNKVALHVSEFYF